jgi:sugar O-acyltransferase (sialic acid O-acetyltransferase NeuD family)
MDEVVFWGATGQAKVLYEGLAKEHYRLVALIDNNPEVSPPLASVPLLYGQAGFKAWLNERTETAPLHFLVAIGGDRGAERVAIQEELEKMGLLPLVLVHQAAYVAQGAALGKGSQVLARAVVGVDARVGRGCIINTGATVDHDCLLDDGVHVCPGAHLAGCVEVGKNAMIGTGAVVLPRVKIGEGATVGAGAVVLKDVPPGSVVVGNPARTP